MIPKRDSDELRLITNLKNLNPFLQTTYFHLPTLQGILPFFKKNMWATSIDIKSAYLHWPISDRDKPYLCFEYGGRYFQHQALPFGLSVAPREWQRAMQAVVKYMRKQGALIWVYLDDFLLLGYTAEEVATQTAVLVKLLKDLGVQINWDKSELNPVQTLRYLGFLLNLLEGKVEVPTKKLTAIMGDVSRLLKVSNPSARKVASVLGRLRSLLFALPQIKLWTDKMAAHIQQLAQWGWEATAPLPKDIVDQLHQTMDLLQSWKGKPFVPDLPPHTLFSDASDLGWGAVSQGSPDPIAGWFPPPLLQEHISLKETRAILEAIKVYNLRNVHLQVYTDSTTVYWYIRKWGGRSLHLNALVKELWTLCNQRNLVLTPHWIPSAENPADGPSRKAWSPLANSILHPQVVRDILHQFSQAKGLRPACHPRVDWMAEREEAQFPTFVTPLQNIFAQDLTLLSPGWVNPPWGLIPHLLNYWATFPKAVQGLAVLPFKPQAPWWALKCKMQVGESLLIQHHHGLFLDAWGNPLQGPSLPLEICLLQGLSL